MKKLFFLFIITATILSKQSIAQTTFQKIYGNAGTSTYESSSDVIQTTDGGYAIIGNNVTGIYFIKTNANGDTIWTKTYTNPSGWANSIRQTTDGGYIIAGDYFSTSDYQALLIKTNSIGSVLWSKLYGGADDDVATNAQQTTDGGYIFTGYTAINSGQDYEIYLVKLNSTGNILWSKTYGGTEWDLGGHIEQTSDEGYIISGHSQNPMTYINDVLLLKVDSSGNLSWIKTIGDTGNDFPHYVRQTSDGGYILVGFTNSFNSAGETFLLKTNSSGAVQWAKTYIGVNGKMVYELNNGEYIIAGESSSGASLIKVNSIGDTVWTKSYNVLPASYSKGWSVKPTTDSGFIFCGDITIPGDTSSIYLVKTDSNGNGVCFNSIQNVNVSQITFTISTPIFQSSSLNTNSTFSLQTVNYGVNVTNPCITGINEIALDNLITIFPNPSNGTFTIKSEKEKINMVIIYNVLGEKIYSMQINSYNAEIDLSKMTKGIYLISITQDNKVIKTDKLVITD